MGFLKRNIRSASQAAKETAYKTFVRPIVEYAATTWAPFTDTVTCKIEKVQRRAAQFVSNDYRRTSSVTEMISTLGWDTLQKRRDLARLSMMYRIVHHLVDIPVIVIIIIIIMSLFYEDNIFSTSTYLTYGPLWKTYHTVQYHTIYTVEPYLTPLTSRLEAMTLASSSSGRQHNLPTELLPKNRNLVEPTPSDDNAGGLPEPAGHPYLLNATPCF